MTYRCWLWVAVLSALVMANAGTAIAQTPSFSRADYPVATYPIPIIAADFNGDGIPDLAVGNNGAFSPTPGLPSTVGILLGNADGTFRPMITYDVGSQPIDLAVGDFNRDGKLDLAVANWGSATVSILLGNGDGTFQPQLSFAAAGTAPGTPYSVVTADFNRDGKLDLVVSNWQLNTISIFLGNGDGTFQAGVDYPTAAHPQFMAVGDFNGDGNLDVAVAGAGANLVSVLPGNGDGTFGERIDSPVSSPPNSLTAADFNRDGKLDLAVPSQNDNAVHILIGNGDGSFQPETLYPVPGSPGQVRTADFNRDGKIDLVANSSTAVSILLGNRDGTFQSPVDYAIGNGGGSVAVGDFNGDGSPDIATSNNADGTVSVLLNTTPPQGSGALRLTDVVGSQASGLFYNKSIPTAQGLVITFKQYQYGGDGADGIAFVLAVAPPPGTFPPAPTSIGSLGGALGYTSGDVVDGTGLPGGWLGIGLDVYGNFTSTKVDGSGCMRTNPPWASSDNSPNEVTVRGPGNGNVGYCLLSSSLEAGGSVPLGPSADRASSLRSVKIVIAPESYTYTVFIAPSGGGDYSRVTSGSLPSFYYKTTGERVDNPPYISIPPYVTFGWTAATGGLVDIHEITDVDVKTLYPAADLFSDAFTGATTTAPVFGLPSGAGFPCLTAGTDLEATPVPGCAAVAGFTTTFAQSVPNVTVPATGSASAILGNIEIDESAAGTLSVGARIFMMLPAGLTFVSVSPTASNGLAVGAPLVDQGGARFSFQVTAPSTTGPGSIIVSGISVAVPAVPRGPFCNFESPGAPVCVTVSATEGSGFTGVPQRQIGTFVTPPAGGLTLTSVSIRAVGEGVTRTITLTGSNFNLLDFDAGDTISFGPGITVVPGSIVVSADGTKITLTIQVAGDAPTGPQDVIITHNGEQFVFSGQFDVNEAPTVISAGTGPDGLSLGPLLIPLTGDGLKGQALIIKGTGFQAPTTVPSDLRVAIGGTGITVNSVGFTSATEISVDVDVAGGAQSVARTVTVTNPDLGTTTSSAPILAVQAAPQGSPVGLSPTATSGTVTLPPTPQVTKITPISGPAGFAPITITGKNFSATAANNLVTFTTANNRRVVATIISATSTTLKVVVPAAAVDGPVTVAVSGVQQSGTLINFTVTDPTLSAVTVPDGPTKRGGPQVHVHLIGSKFQTNAKVAFNPADNLTLGSLNVTATEITVPVTVGAGAALGLRDVTVTNPDGASSTLPQSFAVNGQFDMALSLTTLGGVAIPSATTDFPSVERVEVTLDALGKCTARTITPTVYLLTVSFPGAHPTTLPPLTFSASSSAIAGTATNDDCEPNLPALPAEKDFSIGPVDQPPNVASQQIMVSPVNGVYRLWLASWDWGGTVHVDVSDNPRNPAAATVGTGITLPVSSVPFGPAMSAVDGLTNFHKRRGVYLLAPNKGNIGQLENHVRLDLGMRNLFVRGLGFSTDLTLGDNNCGLDSITGAKVPADPDMPCPKFQVGDAFTTAGVKVWDVSSSFNAAGTTVFPTQSLADPTKPMLHLATVKYDVVNCSGGAPCNTTSKLGPRQWNFPTLGFSTFGNATTYGRALVLGKSFKAYFLDRPYKHLENVAGAFLPVPTSGPTAGKPMLAPITIVCDKASGGSDDGNVQSGECAVNGVPGGDAYRPGEFRLDMTTMDVNNDGCVELPFVADPTTLTPCNQSSNKPSLDNSASAPQATFQQAVRHVITHELGHAVGVNIHTSVATDLMYMYSINWARADVATLGSFSPQSGALMQIHNTGQPTVQP